MKLLGIFLDSSFFLAFCHPDDENHDDANKLFDTLVAGKYGMIYTSPYVISEAATLFLVRSNNNSELINDFYSILQGEEKISMILPWNDELDFKIWELFKSANKKAKTKKLWLSFVDCSNIIYCQEYQIKCIASFDGHFQPFLDIVK